MPLTLTYDKGLNTAKDESSLDNGEMVQATGVFYKPGDQRAHKIGGVTEFADTSSAKRIDGTALLQFDSGGTDKVVALSDRVLYSANLSTTGASGTFTTLKSGLGTLATSLSAAQFNDKQYLALGAENLAVKSDGTTHKMGMSAPTGTLTGAATLGTILIRPSSNGGTYSDPANAYDTDLATYAHTTLSAAATSTETFSWSGTGDTGSARVLAVKYALSGFPVLPEYPSDGDFDDVGGTFDSGFTAKIKFEISENNGSSFTTVLEQTRSQATGELYAQFDVTDALEINGNLQLKVSLQYLTGDTNASLFIYDLNVNDGGTGANITVTTGVFYAVSEFDENESDNGPAIYSAIIGPTALDGTKNSVLLTFPTAGNTRATHWKIWRTTDGGSIPSGLGLIDTKPIASTTYIDRFAKFDKDTQALPLYPLLRTLSQQDATSIAPIYFPQDSPPRRFVRLRTYEGSLVGLSAEETRKLWYSMAGKPQSWPEINVIVDSCNSGARVNDAAYGPAPRGEFGTRYVPCRSHQGCPGLRGPVRTHCVLCLWRAPRSVDQQLRRVRNQRRFQLPHFRCYRLGSV